MISLYGQYVIEREGKQILETDSGFATYTIAPTEIGNQIFVHDLFILQNCRKSKEASNLVDQLLEIAADNNCTHAMSTVDPRTNGATTALKFQLHVGMNLYKTANGLVYLYMELPRKGRSK